MENLIMVENIIKNMKFDLIALERNLMTSRRMGHNLKDEVVLINDVPYKVSTDRDCFVTHLSAITEVDQVDIKTNLSLKIKFDIDKKDLDCMEFPKLLNTNNVKGTPFRQFIMCYKVWGF